VRSLEVRWERQLVYIITVGHMVDNCKQGFSLISNVGSQFIDVNLGQTTKGSPFFESLPIFFSDCSTLFKLETD
jgi:hypothetical protein